MDHIQQLHSVHWQIHTFYNNSDRVFDNYNNSLLHVDDGPQQLAMGQHIVTPFSEVHQFRDEDTIARESTSSS